MPGIIGSLQANEVIKIITGVGEPLSGRLFAFDALAFSSKVFKIGVDKTNPLSGEHPTQTKLIDYQQFCGILPEAEQKSEVQEISVQDLDEWQKSGKDFQLIDVREPHEYEIVNIGAELIPLKTVVENADKFAKNKPVVVHCKMGGRSANAIKALKDNGVANGNLYNLKGGITAYAKEVDTSLATY